jgi:hypothetical protein
MVASPKLTGVLVGFAVMLMADNAGAISVELAKKCSALLRKHIHPRVIGNPAAGSDYGTGPEMRAYYRNCVASGGEMPNPKP